MPPIVNPATALGTYARCAVVVAVSAAVAAAAYSAAAAVESALQAGRSPRPPDSPSLYAVLHQILLVSLGTFVYFTLSDRHRMGWQRFAERAGVQLLVWSPFVALVVVLVALASSRNVVFSVVPFLRIPAVMVVQLCNMPSEKATLKDVFSDGFVFALGDCVINGGLFWFMAFLVGANDFAQPGSIISLLVSFALVTATLIAEHLLYFHVLKILRDGTKEGKSPSNTTMSLSQSNIGSMVSLTTHAKDLSSKSFLQKMATTMLIIAFYHPVAVFTTLRKPADQDGSFYILVALMVLFKPFKTWLNLCWSLFKTRSDTTLSLRRKIETFLSSNYDSSIVIYQRIAIHSSNGVALIAAIFFFAGDSPVQSLSAGCIGRLGGLTSAKIAGRWAIITAAEVMVDVWCVIYRAWARSARHRVRPAEPEDMQSMVDTEAKHESNARGADRDGDADSAMSNRVEDRLVWLGISCALGLTSAVSTCGGVAYLKGLFGSQECNVLGVT